MKTCILIGAILIFHSTAFSQTKVERKGSMIDTVDHKQLDNVANAERGLEVKERILEERLKQASDTIANLNSVLSGLGIIVGVVIAIVALVLPFLSYFFVIKPQREVHNLIKDKIADYIIAERERTIDQALDNMASNDNFLRARGFKIIQEIKTLPQTEKQIRKMINLIKGGPVNDQQKEILAIILVYQESELVEDFYEQILTQTTHPVLKNSAIRYFLRPTSKIGYDVFFQVMANAANKKLFFIDLIETLKSYDKGILITFLDDARMVNPLVDELGSYDKMQSFGTNIRNKILQSESAVIAIEEFDQTLFCKTMMGNA